MSATIPFALLFAVVILVLSGESANLLSMGAIDFGIIVDATVIMVENIFRHLAEASAGRRPTCTRPTPRGMTGKIATIYHASGEVTQAIFFSATIIIAGFLPLFTLSGVEGHIFGPMAKTYAYALSGGLLATFTVSPALSALLLPREGVGNRDHRRARPAPVLSARASPSCWRDAGSTLAGGAALVVTRRPGRRARSGWSSCPSSRRATSGCARRCRPRCRSTRATPTPTACAGLVKSFPEVETVITQHGRPDDGTDPDGFSNVEFFVPLKPFDKWRKGLSTRRT